MSVGTFVQHHVPVHMGGRPIIAATLGLVAVVAAVVGWYAFSDDDNGTGAQNDAAIEALHAQQRATILERITIGEVEPAGAPTVEGASAGTTSDGDSSWKLDRIGDGGDVDYGSAAGTGGAGPNLDWKFERIGDGG